ncbi:uncharacterized protein F4812DRAFT_376134 [Daldinia caldariorum]|uniref:uncharacterized protein n=1 Tax=Daldinia caldariorum TaxID=326644 RepID=UPI002008524B|nr:uncharacterized protein F4812DRAFT_376134 [Daldinia caldariorum]KAI1467774.1 hypothetical protein F4812DRAFT_376134 [Daldinia caldariorum]
MMFITVFTSLALLAGRGLAQDTTGLLPCASGCVSGVFANTAAMGCGLNDRLCVCGKSSDFSAGIRDCINKVCPSESAAAQISIAQGLGNSECEAASSAAGVLSSPTPTPTLSPPASSATSQPTEQVIKSAPPTTTAETTQATKPSPSPASQPGFSAAEVESTASSSTPAATESSAPAKTSAASSSSAPSTTSSNSAVAAGATSTAEKTDEESSPSQNGGLSVGARAGIGASVGVAVVVLMILAFCFLRRRGKKPEPERAQTMQISQPLPGSGRQYAEGVRQPDPTLSKDFTPRAPSPQSANRTPSPVARPYSPSTASYASELDANARPYEDLSPRTQPRTMI